MASHLLTAEEQRVFDDQLAESLTHYPSDRKSAAMLPVLHLLQSMKGWLPPDGMEMVARRLEVAPARVYEVATFYVMFHTSRPGKYVVEVCTNLSCSLWGAEELLAYLEQKLGVHAGEGSGTWTLREAECLASCGTAPCLQINSVHHENLRSRAAVDAVFAKLAPA
jgi:NADH-quinone oxidoreductase subunit E